MAGAIFIGIMLKALSGFQNGPQQIAATFAEFALHHGMAVLPVLRRQARFSQERFDGQVLVALHLHVEIAVMVQHLSPQVFQGVFRQAAPVQPVNVLVKLRLEVGLHLLAYLALSQSRQCVVLAHYSPTGCKMTGQIASPIWTARSQGDADGCSLSLY